MKAVFVTLGLIASFASFTAASPAADAASQLQGRSPEPIICIGCINDDCQSHSEPSGCAVSQKSTRRLSDESKDALD